MQIEIVLKSHSDTFSLKEEVITGITTVEKEA